MKTDTVSLEEWIRALTLLQNYVERYNKQDEDKEVAEAASLVQEYIEYSKTEQA